MRPWLLTILRNTARNAARDAARRPGPPPAFEPAEPAVAGPSVEQQVEQELTQREWAGLLGRLPEAQRTAVVLRHVEGVPTGEIAQILGCPRAPPSPTSRAGSPGYAHCWPKESPGG